MRVGTKSAYVSNVRAREEYGGLTLYGLGTRAKHVHNDEAPRSPIFETHLAGFPLSSPRRRTLSVADTVVS